MDAALLSLIAASLTLVGTHIALSHPLRAPLIGAIGEGGFQLLYNAVSVAALVWMYFAFRAAPAADLPGSGNVGWFAATILTLPALVLFLGSITPRNPALPVPGAASQAGKAVKGVFRVTRHPMMWGFALWAVSHLILWWSWRTNVLALAILTLALLGAHLQDRKKRALMGEAWRSREARTTYLPRLAGFRAVGWKLWVAAILAWLAISWAHMPLRGVPAGIWSWL
ncbi:NnrU family protein [Aurantiacibacter aquimixticola]|uniref:MFS transporter n=1 Tax=Aurantiacibacter aquimixticola TaxID=1958945 RepID=A0A419RUQ0_9SPHN|nr:NnrU family protein [Aurantiacibacter aquimixticola]RJY09500.1 MFS transporter [Aurantiacibacter aquimixticola]